MKQTSLFAWQRNSKKKLNIKERIYQLLDWHFHGMTAYEVKQELDLPITSIRPRLTDLFKEGRVIEAGTKWDREANQQCLIYKRR